MLGSLVGVVGYTGKLLLVQTHIENSCVLGSLVGVVHIVGRTGKLLLVQTYRELLRVGVFSGCSGVYRETPVSTDI